MDRGRKSTIGKVFWLPVDVQSSLPICGFHFHNTFIMIFFTISKCVGCTQRLYNNNNNNKKEKETHCSWKENFSVFGAHGGS
ncbi:unnamed protein product [Prunus armeniaca]|uniref:Uncharacterized protein n=1 Tax=Prunus armeniaca TaxID=36596 RepID=A0A6J5WYT9_PRUAR|nr:unnamed protein product [Prunus armeniaca]CAB4306669.1 unnamed protein product [Prunus armeniaca]